jgi:NAD(P)-dependent dehydrogenase (short-subunit alcohol dehydrogenase family)
MTASPQPDGVRTTVVTGAASGIGRALCELLDARGERVIDVDLHGASVVADLSTGQGVAAMAEEVARRTGGVVDAVAANAGTTATPELAVLVNYFGAVRTLDALRPLLTRSSAPRAVATASSAVFYDSDRALAEACLADDEVTALALAPPLGQMAYAASKRALARWVRRQAPTANWAGAGIALNAVGPGIVETPMMAPMIADPVASAGLAKSLPMPFGGYARAEHIAQVLAFFTAATTERITGQVLFVDGGAHCHHAGDDIW